MPYHLINPLMDLFPVLLISVLLYRMRYLRAEIDAKEEALEKNYSSKLAREITFMRAFRVIMTIFMVCALIYSLFSFIRYNS
ncbi:hypothetical protein [Flavilitoribacter nigricans]|uniref:Uncharacterized protein n=1 Tax=Flavilitoribacter nigricans (strain ATCC 23147 / DSM 23189 / NBRC 102662 / NCIMB 1420 / SS-2) TaxID=1122177 RepID=A0A2D0NIU1_FLAN2|nr:hypothetical protein [Flavilitoribacter nigricans]PHN08310.1 hypothetical protein CRP01_03020 [Flavilitoribacter nigricans DSM 23189 = NBRC 102662]